MQLTEGGLLHLEGLGDDGLLLGGLGARLDVADDERDLHDVVHGRHQQVRQLQLLAPRVTIAPLQLRGRTSIKYVGNILGIFDPPPFSNSTQSLFQSFIT